MYFPLRSFRRVARLFIRDPAFRSLLLAAVLVLLTGSVFYHFVEGWGWIDSLYFCTVTLSTIGYGDFVPQSDAARLFTVFYILLGIGIFATFITAVATARLAESNGTSDASHPPRRSALRSLRQHPSSGGDSRPRRRYRQHRPTVVRPSARKGR